MQLFDFFYDMLFLFLEKEKEKEKLERNENHINILVVIFWWFIWRNAVSHDVVKEEVSEWKQK